MASTTALSREIDSLFSRFEASKEALVAIANQNTAHFDRIYPRALRLLYVRTCLALGIDVRFNSRYSLTKSEQTAKAYQELVKSNECWFAFEALGKLSAHLLWKKANVQCAADIFDQTRLTAFDIGSILSKANGVLREQLYASAPKKRDLISFLQFAEREVEKESLKRLLRATSQRVQQEAEFLHQDFMALLYASRNLFVHRAESAKAGVRSYSSKTLLLKLLREYGLLFIMKAGICAFEQALADARTQVDLSVS